MGELYVAVAPSPSAQLEDPTTEIFAKGVRLGNSCIHDESFPIIIKKGLAKKVQPDPGDGKDLDHPVSNKGRHVPS